MSIVPMFRNSTLASVPQGAALPSQAPTPTALLVPLWWLLGNDSDQGSSLSYPFYMNSLRPGTFVLVGTALGLCK